MSSTPSVDLYNRVSDIIDECAQGLVNMVTSLPAVPVDPTPDNSRSNDSTTGSTGSVSSEVPPLPPVAPSLSDEVRVSPAPSGSTTSSAPSSSTSCTSMTEILKKFKGKMIDGRLYRSLDKKHLVHAQLVSLEEPMGDEEAMEFERALNSNDSDFCLTDPARTAPKGYTITRL